MRTIPPPLPRRSRVAGGDRRCVALLAPAAWSEELGKDLAAKLTPEQRKIYLDYSKAKGQHDKRHNAYWAPRGGQARRRRAKRLLAQAYDADDYIAQQPPKYAGPELPAEIAKIVIEVKPPVPAPPLPKVADFLAHAKALYGFVPTPTSEQDFKRRYAQEALAVGLTKDQVVRIYALETGGQGTYDMQSGINPLTKQGRAISSALGYAQLLHANSTSELVKYGEASPSACWRWRRRRAPRASAPKRCAPRRRSLRRMLREARSIPNEWGAHVKFAGTPKGLGIHTLNLDADVGPWLQVLKLKALKDEAAAAGRASLTGSRDRADEPRRPAHRPRDDDAGRPEHADGEFLQRGRLLPQHHRAREDRRRAAAGAQRPHGGQREEARRRSSSRRSSTRLRGASILHRQLAGVRPLAPRNVVAATSGRGV